MVTVSVGTRRHDRTVRWQRGRAVAAGRVVAPERTTALLRAAGCFPGALRHGRRQFGDHAGQRGGLAGKGQTLQAQQAPAELTVAGLSTGGLMPGRPLQAAAAAARYGTDLIELSALAGDELDAVLAALPTVRQRFARVHVHAPAKRRISPDHEVVAQLAAADVDVVVHPDVIDDVTVWRRLGRRLLVENNDSRKRTGQDSATLAALLSQLPDARVCLDISHALDAGGPDLVVELASSFRRHVALFHIGCSCGHATSGPLGEVVVASFQAARAIVGDVPVVVERDVSSQADPAGAAAELLAELRRG